MRNDDTFLMHASCLSRAGAGAITNEDHASCGSDWIVVLDGSSGLTGRRYTSGVTDAAWFVASVARQLRRRLDAPRSAPLPEVISSALADVQSEYQAQIGGARVDVVDQPSASAAVVRLGEDTIEYFVIGDCTLFFHAGDDLRVVEDSRVAVFDRTALTAFENELTAGQTPTAARRTIQPLLVKNRYRKNTPDGYWVLAPDPACAAHGLSGVIPLRKSTKIFAVTDGFSALADQLDCFPDRRALFEFIVREGLEAAERMLLSATEADPDCVRHPRFKKRDDYSGVIGRIASQDRAATVAPQ